ncbi:hypothetical protein PC116_g20695 [Phytophthora cactorum]|nr:hypothetical protein PC116_g20695 [Phytophthora cactorum]
MSTATHQHMLMLSHVPFFSSEFTTWLLTPIPNTIMTKVPRNSARHSRMCTLWTAYRETALPYEAETTLGVFGAST